jgi:hypothetical protein
VTPSRRSRQARCGAIDDRQAHKARETIAGRRAPLLPTLRLSAKLRQIGTEAAAIRYVAELIGAGTAPEKAGPRSVIPPPSR